MNKFPSRLNRLAVSIALVLLSLQAAGLSQGGGQQQSQDAVIKFINSVAGATYKLAWPTATYRSCSIAEIRPANSGFDVIVKLSGISAFDNEELWLLLGFAFRDGVLKDTWVVRHNAILAEPFQTSKTMLQVAVDLAKQYAQSMDQAGAICLVNASTTTLVFEYRWGNGPWQQGRLGPSASYLYWWPYQRGGEHASPPFQIRYDDSFEEGYTEQNYTLDRYAASLPLTCQAAKQYSFTTDGRKVFLRSVN